MKARTERGDEGFMLIFAIILIFLVMLALSVAAPRIAKQLQRDKEQESARRAEQYVRAIRIFYLKFHRYPTSIEQLDKTNNQRFLRAHYIDPLTGKDDWRIIHQGENKTTVKGFFGDDLPGLQAGLGAAGGLGSSIGGAQTTGGTASGSAFNNSGIGGAGAGSAFGQSGAGTTGTTGATTGSSTGSSGVASQDATTFTGSGGGPIIGIGSSKSGDAMLVVNEQDTYQDWEFLYDPRIEALYAKGNLLGGIASGSGTSGGFGTPISGTLPAAPAGFGGTPTTPATGTTPPQ